MKKIRRPREIDSYKEQIVLRFDPSSYQCVYVSTDHWLTLRQAKRLHAWLGRAIKYLEQEKK